MKLQDRSEPPEKRLEKSLERVMSHLNRGRLPSRQLGHLRSWTMELAHAAYELHPELRDDGCLERYFVAKLGRQQGHRGEKLTEFVDRAYETGLAKFAIEAGMESWANKNTRSGDGQTGLA